MKIANVSNRLALVTDDGVVDVAEASDGRFGPGVDSVYRSFDEFRQWAAAAALPAAKPLDRAALGSPVTAPRQLFAIGLNYRAHAEESGFAAPPSPAVFTKFVSCIDGPYTTVTMPDGHVDWEIELVAVIGKDAYQVDAAHAWEYVAGLTAGQDLSERVLQMVGSVPQFSLGKSYPGFAPMGPYLVTPDEFANPDDLAIGCTINGEQMQDARTSQMIFSVPALIESLSGVLPLYAGDVIFTGTPAGVGLGRKPQRWLQAGDVLTSTIEGIGTLEQTFVKGV